MLPPSARRAAEGQAAHRMRETSEPDSAARGNHQADHQAVPAAVVRVGTSAVVQSDEKREYRLEYRLVSATCSMLQVAVSTVLVAARFS